MPCPYSAELSYATHLRKCSIDGVSCGEDAWKNKFLNCPEYLHQKYVKKEERKDVN